VCGSPQLERGPWEPLGASGSLCTQYYRILPNSTESRLRAHLFARGEACRARPGGSLRGIPGPRYRLFEHEAIAQNAAVDIGSGSKHKCVWEPPASGSLWEPLGASGSLWEPLGASGSLCTQYYRILPNITESRLRAHLFARGEACGDRPGGSLRGMPGPRDRLSEHEAIAQNAAVDTTRFGSKHKCVWEPPASGSLWEPLGASGSLCTQYYRILPNITESRLRAHLFARGEACGDRPGGSLRGMAGPRYRLSEHEAVAQSAAVDTGFRIWRKRSCGGPQGFRKTVNSLYEEGERESTIGSSVQVVMEIVQQQISKSL
jgi:hypothetical protein